ncbi:exodeoxyribonuclease VII large subunit [Thaumasiovibrio subtropicus]|uniref:exodeoxyribonuclease VII large subunit n=1 Tax=Thaumasiovibrio subtropicus TaxID=1891207 RepID=UPI000B3591B4|nr:exodeoxyribonuclease VII large subunit [Thaumasiovibrio subtropicus]
MTTSLSQQNSRIFTVSALNAEVRLLLENEMGIVWLVGELSNLSMPVSGHWYFTLKDSRAQVKCAMFKGHNRRVNFKPVAGNQVLVKARLSLYEPRGDYQLIVESMQPEGDGRLQQQFEVLKTQLAQEGLFAQSLKQPLPTNPQRVGIITSKSGAALQDILNVLERRDPGLPIVIYPTMVQGEGAAISIAQAIGNANVRNECDVLIVGRGGGALEDLWCFNEEIVARTIASSQIPIISAVGHEVDVTIADFVADMRAPTPSAAAELVSRDQSEQKQKIFHVKSRLQQAIRLYITEQQQTVLQQFRQLEQQHPQRRLMQQAQQVDELSGRLQQSIYKRSQQELRKLTQLSHQLTAASPAYTLPVQQSNMTALAQRLNDAMQQQLKQTQHRFSVAATTLDAVSPLAVLARGFSITTDAKGKPIVSAETLKTGDTIITRLQQGEVVSTVNQTRDAKAQ